MISGHTRVFALLGDPVAHSLSPVIHNAAFLALGLDAVYVALRCDAPQVPSLMASLCYGGGGGNLTVPHKRIGATVARPAAPGPWSVCNTFWGEDGAVVGTSTDPAGVLAGWTQLGRPPGGWLILGTGGSAVAAAEAARASGVPVGVHSRSAARAQAFEAEVQTLGGRVDGTGPVGMVINCTPLGLAADDPMPLSVGALPPGSAVLDLVYGRGETPWVVAARRAGHQALDGRAVLLGQGLLAFERWFPGVAAPVEVMNAALHRALA